MTRVHVIPELTPSTLGAGWTCATSETDQFSQDPNDGKHFIRVFLNFQTPTFGRAAGAYIDF
jgi:hypothetical protein